MMHGQKNIKTSNSGMSVDAVGRVAYIKFSHYIKSAPSYFGNHMEITGQVNVPAVLIPVPVEKNGDRAQSTQLLETARTTVPVKTN
jgi:hypothetical protein